MKVFRLLLIAALPLTAQDSMTPGIVAQNEHPATEPQKPTVELSDTESASAPAPAVPDLPPSEAHIRQGIGLLLQLRTTLAGVNSPETAEKAVQPILQMTQLLQKWSQGFAALPVLDEETQQVYEDQYLPLLRKINKELKLQGERLASAEYYGSRNLSAALVNLVLTLR